MKYADKMNVANSVILGDEEVDNKILPFRNMETGEVTEIKYDDEYVQNFLEKVFL